MIPVPNVLEAYTVILLRCGGRYLLLRRSPEKSFAPNRWTGVGGHVEQDEYTDLRASALRELEEETGLSATNIENFALRRVLLTNRPGRPLGIVLYYTADLSQPVLPDCPEGVLFWKRPDEFAALDIIETTRPVLDRLIEDLDRDPDGKDLPKSGLGVFSGDGRFQGVMWG